MKILIFCHYHHLNLFICCKIKLRIKVHFLQNDFFYRMKCFSTEGILFFFFFLQDKFFSWNEALFTGWNIFYRMNFFFYGTKLSLENYFFTEWNFFYRTEFFRKGHKYFFANKVFSEKTFSSFCKKLVYIFCS